MKCSLAVKCSAAILDAITKELDYASTKKLLQTFINSLNEIDHGSLQLTLPDGNQHIFSGSQSGPHADMTLHQYDVIKNMVMGGDVALCQDYCKGDWDTENLTNLMMFAIKNEQCLDQHGHISGKMIMRQLGRCVIGGVVTPNEAPKEI